MSDTTPPSALATTLATLPGAASDLAASPNARAWDFPRKPRLLVVDDQPLHIQVLHRALSGDSQIFMATNGLQAIKTAQDRLPDLILLDLEMPDMDGFAVLEALKSHNDTRDIPVIFVTAHNSGEIEARGLDAGAVDFINKPVQPNVVRARVHTHLKLKFQSDFLRQWVYIDGLTGVFNRRYFDERHIAEWARAQRAGQTISLLMLDIDHFKAYNDHYGHLQGDDALRQVAVACQASLMRPGDLIARFGGEEFVCLLPNTSSTEALVVAERMRMAVQSLGIPHGHNPNHGVLTVSLGLACSTQASSCQELISLADAQLYQAKRSGKNRVCVG